MRHMFLGLIALIASESITFSQSIITSGGRGSIVISGRGVPVPVANPTPAVDQQMLLQEILALQAEVQKLKQKPAAVTIAAPKAKSVTIKTAPAAASTTRSMTHSEMVALHNRLHGGGSWTWPGDLATHLRGTHGVSTSKTVAAKSQPVKPASAPRYNIYNGVPNSSHSSRAALINHLLHTGIHPSKRHTLEQLNAMSDQELDDLHTQDHREEGQVKLITIQSAASNCPGGRCPVQNNVRRTRRR